MATYDSSAVPVDSEKGYGTTGGGPNGSVATTTTKNRGPPIKLASAVFRALTFASCLAAFIVMILDKQSRTVVMPLGTGKFWAKYHYSKAFLYFVIANGIGFGYALLTLLLTPFLRSPTLYRILLLLDLLVAYLLLSAASAATAIAYIGNKGLPQANWPRICGTFNRYCDHAAGALVAGFHGWLFLTIAIVFALHRRP